MLKKVARVLICSTLAAVGLTAGAGSAAAANPLGHVDSADYDAKYDTIDIWGWAGDPDAGSAAIRVHVYVDGVGAASVGTRYERDDVAAVYPRLGTHTGFYANPLQPPGRGPHSVCVYAINVGVGGNVLLGCRTVVVTDPLALLGHIDRIATDPADPAMRIASGWVLDPYDAESPTPFALLRLSGPTSGGGWDYLDFLRAGLPRPDVDRAYPHNGHDHGFSVRFAASYVDWAATDAVCLALDDSAFIGTIGSLGTSTPTCFSYRG